MGGDSDKISGRDENCGVRLAAEDRLAVGVSRLGCNFLQDILLTKLPRRMLSSRTFTAPNGKVYKWEQKAGSRSFEVNVGAYIEPQTEN